MQKPQPDPSLLPSKLSSECDNVWQKTTPLSPTVLVTSLLVPRGSKGPLLPLLPLLPVVRGPYYPYYPCWCPAGQPEAQRTFTRQFDCSLGLVLLTPPSTNQRAMLQEELLIWPRGCRL